MSYLEIEVPLELADMIRRHHDNLMQLVESLGNSGVDASMIQRSVDQLVEAYRIELLKSLTSMRGGGDRA